MVKLDDATEVIKDAHLITYVRYLVETDVREDMIFCKSIKCNTTAIKVFIINDIFLN